MKFLVKRIGISLMFFFFLGGTEFRTQGLALVRQVLYHTGTSPTIYLIFVLCTNLSDRTFFSTGLWASAYSEPESTRDSAVERPVSWECKGCFPRLPKLPMMKNECSLFPTHCRSMLNQTLEGRDSVRLAYALSSYSQSLQLILLQNGHSLQIMPRNADLELWLYYFEEAMIYFSFINL
jgi:hypothetical protein